LETEILYFGDFDPSGLDISRDIEEQLLELGADITLTRIALTEEQIMNYWFAPVNYSETVNQLCFSCVS